MVDDRDTIYWHNTFGNSWWFCCLFWSASPSHDFDISLWKMLETLPVNEKMVSLTCVFLSHFQKLPQSDWQVFQIYKSLAHCEFGNWKIYYNQISYSHTPFDSIFNSTNLTKARDNCTEAKLLLWDPRLLHLRSNGNIDIIDIIDIMIVLILRMWTEHTQTHTDIWWKRRMSRRGSATFKGDYVTIYLVYFPHVSQ